MRRGRDDLHGGVGEHTPRPLGGGENDLLAGGGRQLLLLGSIPENITEGIVCNGDGVAAMRLAVDGNGSTFLAIPAALQKRQNWEIVSAFHPWM